MKFRMMILGFTQTCYYCPSGIPNQGKGIFIDDNILSHNRHHLVQDDEQTWNKENESFQEYFMPCSIFRIQETGVSTSPSPGDGLGVKTGKSSSYMFKVERRRSRESIFIFSTTGADQIGKKDFNFIF